MTRKTFDLGTTDRSTTLSLPNDLAGRRSAIFGISGSGKSNTATVCVEGLIANGEQVVMIDPKGEGWGLLSRLDGTPSDIDVVVFGEPHGHVESINETHGPHLADFVVESGRSVVLSLLGFESDQSERRFVATFLRQLYRRKSRQPQPTRTCVVLEEAHLFVPESPRGDAAELAGAVQRLVRQGRSQGIGVILVDQRPQDVAKRVITQCETVICHQLVHKLDRAALREWVRGYDRDDQGETFIESLASLKPGEAWVWSPGWLGIFDRAQIRRRWTFDSGASPDGAAAAVKVSRATVDLDALRDQLGELVEAAKANDPAMLKRRIAELEKQLAQQAPQVDEQAIERAVASRDHQWIQLIRENVAHMKKKMGEAVDELRHKVSLLPDGFYLGDHAPLPPANRRSNIPDDIQPNYSAPAKPARTTNTKTPLKSGSSDLTPSEQAVLNAAAAFPNGATRSRIAIYGGRSPKSSSFKASFPGLEAKGLLERVGDNYRATDAGRAIAQEQPAVTLADWLGKLKPSEAKVLQCIVDAYPGVMTRAEVSQRTGQSDSSSSFKAAFPALRALELITGNREYRAADALMEAK